MKINFSKVGINIVGIIIFIYGAKSVIEGKIIAEGNSFKSGWQLQGDEAILVRSVIAIFGLYVIFIAYKYGGK